MSAPRAGCARDLRGRGACGLAFCLTWAFLGGQGPRAAGWAELDPPILPHSLGGGEGQPGLGGVRREMVTREMLLLPEARAGARSPLLHSPLQA